MAHNTGPQGGDDGASVPGAGAGNDESQIADVLNPRKRSGLARTATPPLSVGLGHGSSRLPSRPAGLSAGHARLHVFGSHAVEMLFLVLLVLAALLMLMGDQGKDAARRQVADWWSSLAGTPEPQQAPVRFSIGATKEMVRKVQGEPTEIHESVWRYGHSKVYFIGDRVSGWKSSPRNPLKTLPAAGE